jgi:hypothetical protein|uniref:Uncharacterized protein n=1 Tax=Myoviridae sp. ctB3C22 TaxID=2826629 RepID=A0A8S5QWQ5_9CAUD|nr:MAG TPA: hypothetical protein [Myoviridae sp. ctB3C22]
MKKNTDTIAKTLEQRVAEAILQKTSDSVEIAGTVYEVAPPTPATLIMVSELVSQLPPVNKDAKNILHEVLRTAKDAKVIGKIAAVLILGAKRIREGHTVSVCHPTGRKRFNLKHFRFEEVAESETIPEIDFVARTILEEVETKTLAGIVGRRLVDLQVGDFFGLTTSLSETNILRETREVEETAFGE